MKKKCTQWLFLMLITGVGMAQQKKEFIQGFLTTIYNKERIEYNFTILEDLCISIIDLTTMPNINNKKDKGNACVLVIEVKMQIINNTGFEMLSEVLEINPQKEEIIIAEEKIQAILYA